MHLPKTVADQTEMSDSKSPIRDWSAGRDIRRNDQLGETPGTVHQIALPPDARALSTLSRIDYEDAFLVEIGESQRTGEQWARAILEGAPSVLRSRLRWSWAALGLKLSEPRADRGVLGWELRASTPEFALLGAGSRVGMPAELLFKRQQQRLLFATFVQHQNPIVRATWARVVPQHRHVVRYLLRGACSHACSSDEAPRIRRRAQFCKIAARSYGGEPSCDRVTAVGEHPQTTVLVSADG